MSDTRCECKKPKPVVMTEDEGDDGESCVVYVATVCHRCGNILVDWHRAAIGEAA